MSKLVVSVPNEKTAADLGELPDGVELIVWPMDAAAPRTDIDLVVTPYMGVDAKGIYSKLPGVQAKLVQAQSIGYDSITPVLPEGFVLANAAGVHEESTAELGVALTLAAQRELPRFVRAASEGHWSPVIAASLADRRVLLLGYGGVSKAIAERLAPFGVALTVVAHTARVEGGVTVHGIDELMSLLPDAEIVIAALPDIPSTRHLIGDAELSALPDGALVVNVGRGSLIDPDALLDHATRGRIRAALDVTEPEPLPEGHPLFALPNVLISPHVGGASSAMPPRIARLIRTQIDRMLRGEEPVNVVVRS